MMGKRIAWGTGALVAGGLAVSGASAQPAPPGGGAAGAALSAAKAQQSSDKFERQMESFQNSNRIHINDELPPGQRVLVDYGGYISFNYLTVYDANLDNHILRQPELVGYAHLNLDGVHEVFLRARSVYNDYADDDSFDGRGDREHTALEQAFYRFDLQRYLGAYKGEATNDDLAIQGGRQTVIWGNGLTFNQDIDGAVVDLIKGPLSVEGVAGVTVPDTIDYDPTRPAFDHKTRRGFYGVLASYQMERHRPYAYILFQRDYNGEKTRRDTIAGSGAEPTVIGTEFAYDSTYLGAGSTGSLSDKLLYGIEGTLEGGSGLSNSIDVQNSAAVPIPQGREPIYAAAADARLDYLLTDTHHTRLSAEGVIATGDRDRNQNGRGSTNGTFFGNKGGTHDNAFNGFGLISTGLAFAPAVSNILILRVGASTQPLNQFELFRKLDVGADFYVYNKLTQIAPIDEPTSQGRFLGIEPDLFMNWQISSDLTLAVRYGSFIPSNHITSSDRDRQFFFTGFTLAF
jgi:hypothetical protein